MELNKCLIFKDGAVKCEETLYKVDKTVNLIDQYSKVVFLFFND